MKATSESRTLERRAISIAACPNSRPSAKLSVEIEAAPIFSSAEAASNSLRNRAAYGKVSNATKRAGGRDRSSSSTMAALTPSCEVPDIRPMAMTLPRSSLIVIALIFIHVRFVVFVVVQIVRATQTKGFESREQQTPSSGEVERA